MPPGRCPRPIPAGNARPARARKARGSCGSILRKAFITGGPSTGSVAPIAMKLSPFHEFVHQSRALREIAAPGASGRSGTRFGNARAPAFEREIRIRRVVRVRPRPAVRCGQVRCISLPQGRSGVLFTYARQATKPSDSGTSPVPSAVFMTSRRSKRSGISIGSVRPSKPPQSCTTSVMRVQVQPLDEVEQERAVHVEGVEALVLGLVGAAEADEVRRHHARAGGEERRDHAAIQVAPGRLAVQAEEGPLALCPRPGSGRAGRATRGSAARRETRADSRNARRACAWPRL